MSNEKKGKIYDKNALRTIECRKRDLEKSLEQIRDVMEGGSTNLHALIQNEDGVINPEKLDQMVEDLMESLAHYKENFGEEPMPDTLREWYKSYLYCAILSPKYIYAHCMYWEYTTGKNFRDLSIYAKELMGYDSLQELIWTENHEWSSEIDVGEDFIFYMNDCLHKLFQKEMKEYYTEEEKQALSEVEPALEWSLEDRIDGYTIKEQIVYEEEQERKQEELLRQEENKRTEGLSETEEGKDAEELQKQIEIGIEIVTALETRRIRRQVESEEEENPGEVDLSKEERELYQYFDENGNPSDQPPYYDNTEFLEWEEQQEIENCVYLINCWEKTIPDPERLLKEYLRFRELFFKVDKSRFADDMRHMVDAYLYENEISAYSLDDTYALVDKAVNGTVERLQREIRRARFLNEQG